MGMFDRVWINCPSCSEEIEAQSKADECMLNSYNLKNAPLVIQADLISNNPYHCDKCAASFDLKWDRIPKIEVSLKTKKTIKK